MARPSAGSRFAAHVIGGAIRGADNLHERRQKQKLLEQELKLRERDLELRERMLGLNQREHALKQQEGFVKDLDVGSAYKKYDTLKGQAQEAGVHRLTGMAEKPSDTPTVKSLKAQYRPADYGVPQGPGLAEGMKNVGGDARTPQEITMDTLRETQLRQSIEKGAFDYEQAQKKAKEADLSPEEKKMLRYFPPDPQQSPLFAPLMEAAQDVYNSGSNPMHGDFPQKLFNTVEERLKQMEGTVTPEVVAKAAKYILENSDIFGGYKTNTRGILPDVTRYAPPGQAPPPPKTAEDIAAGRGWGG